MPAFIHNHAPHVVDLYNCRACIDRAAYVKQHPLNPGTDSTARHHTAHHHGAPTGPHHLLGTSDNSTLADDYARHLARDHTELHLTGTSVQLARFHDDHGGCWYHLDRHTAGADTPPRNWT